MAWLKIARNPGSILGAEAVGKGASSSVTFHSFVEGSLCDGRRGCCEKVFISYNG